MPRLYSGGGECSTPTVTRVHKRQADDCRESWRSFFLFFIILCCVHGFFNPTTSIEDPVFVLILHPKEIKPRRSCRGMACGGKTPCGRLRGAN